MNVRTVLNKSGFIKPQYCLTIAARCSKIFVLDWFSPCQLLRFIRHYYGMTHNILTDEIFLKLKVSWNGSWDGEKHAPFHNTKINQQSQNVTKEVRDVILSYANKMAFTFCQLRFSAYCSKTFETNSTETTQ